MDGTPETTTNDLTWLFSTLQGDMPGSYVDGLVRALLQVNPQCWLEGIRIWKAGQQARRLDPEVTEAVAKLALVWAGKRSAPRR